MLAAALAACQAPRGPVGFWSRNRLDAQQERHGPWRAYFDSAATKLASRGHYRHGRPRGHWRYYAYQGQLDHDDRYRSGGLMLVRHFHANGQVARQGQAHLESDSAVVQYYWFGRWLLYDTIGREIGWELYDKGYRMAQGKGATNVSHKPRSSRQGSK
ncbi:hypothetical protein D3Y59_13740 [Hymenobacter oligotrophus]|uniref:Toxin-antitoxin system YwqK family antitoxin n=1 Tax=Hymenobacter oligotrophus TaxID=2319843 RepID=A0A3B7RBC8_9BACT|nr:hypothetical protein D3Y59_13740 [Hymenobacter oligotrophus]